MKKIVLVFILLFSCILLSCKKNVIGDFKPTALNEMIFELARYSVSGECNLKKAENLFYPVEMNLFLMSHYFEKQHVYLRIEKDFPQYAGLIESSGFYLPCYDNGSWVEEVVLSSEEERIADELNRLEDEIEEMSFMEDHRAEEIEKLLSDSLEEKIYTDRDSKLSLMEYGTEILMPVETQDNYILIKGDEKELSRYFYDKSFRLVKKENWTVKEGTIELKNSEDYTFTSSERKPAAKVVAVNNTREKAQYDDDGKLLKSDKYFIYNNKEYLISSLECKYNDKKKIIQEEKKELQYDENYKRILNTSSIKYVYKYHKNFPEEIPADFEYYEDNVLKKVNKYSKENGTYTSQIYFDEIMSVKTYYVDNKKTKDVYLTNGVVKRVKEYEQK